jgi:ElaA protein
MADQPALRWRSARFEALSLHDLYDTLQLRARVFVLEQGPYLDPDGLDHHSLHVLGRLAGAWGGLPAGEVVLYLRVVDPGHKYDEPSLGRVVAHAALRGTGLGRALVAEGLRLADAAWPGQANRISAQAHLARFYAEFGYATVGESYLEDNIPHIQMLRPARGAKELT